MGAGAPAVMVPFFTGIAISFARDLELPWQHTLRGRVAKKTQAGKYLRLPTQ
jgi:hypothetical protein